MKIREARPSKRAEEVCPMRLARAMTLLLLALGSASALADRAEVERFLEPGEVLVRHAQTRSGADVGISRQRLLVVSRTQLVERHFLDTITHAMVHNRGLSLRLKSGRVLGLSVPMPESAQLVVDLARGAPDAEFQLQSGDRLRLPPGFTTDDIRARLAAGEAPPSATPAAPPVSPLPPGPGMPTDPVLAAISPVYLYVDLGAVEGLSAHIALRKEFKRLPLTLLPDDAKLFASVTLEKATAADTRGTLLGKTKMKSYSMVFLIKVGNRNGDIYASDRVTQQVLGISPEHALSVKPASSRIAALIEQSLVNYALIRAETGSPFVLQDPFK